MGKINPPHGLRRGSRADRVEALRAALRADRPLVLLGAVDALSARLIERAGFSACYVTGAGLANMQYGLPDVGLTGLGEIAEQVRRLSSAVAIPTVADADTGYGGPIAAMRTVHELESAGAAAIQFEDQAMPKKCGHFDGKALVTPDEMAAKLLAAVEARTEDTVIIARTDACAVEGIDSAIHRARRYEDAGADVIFVEAPQDVQQLEQVAESFPDTPLVANIVEGGRTPELEIERLADMGFKIILYANTLMRVAAKAMSQALNSIESGGSSSSLYGSMLSWDERQSLVGLDTVNELEDDFNARATLVADRSRGGQST